MKDLVTNSHSLEEDKEIVDILIDSDLYLDLDIRERFRLIRFLAARYFYCSSR
jgi:hypothetical protein